MELLVKVLEQLDARVGNPIPCPTMMEYDNTNGNPVANDAGPSTPSTSHDRKEPPPLAYKRPKSPKPEEEELAKKARRNLFPTKATHSVKDLNPYQNKYIIQARVTKKSPMKQWSNSRGEGCVFDFVLKDASGEIKVTAFNDDAKKHESMVQEGQVYYLSNAKVQPIRKPEYNTVRFL